MSNTTSFKSNLEKKLAIFLLDELENLRLAPEQVKIIANFILKIIPPQATDKEIKETLSSLDPNIFKYLKQGNFEDALILIKKLDV